MDNLGEYLLIETAMQKRGTRPGLMNRVLWRGERQPVLAGSGDPVSSAASGEVRSP